MPPHAQSGTKPPTSYDDGAVTDLAALLVAGLRRLSADLPGLRCATADPPRMAAAAAVLERLVDNGESGRVLLRRLRRQAAPARLPDSDAGGRRRCQRSPRPAWS